MPYRPNADPPEEFVEGEQVTAEAFNDALDEARNGIAEPPTEAGSYVLTVTIESGEPVYAWTAHT